MGRGDRAAAVEREARWLADIWRMGGGIAIVAVVGLSLLTGCGCYGQETRMGERQTNPSVRTSAPASITPLLTEEERTWLRAHPVIRVTQDPGWPPFEFADERGEPSGISNDYLKLIEQRLGIRFERVRHLTWQESYAGLRRWDLDMTTAVTVTPERTQFWAFTKPFMRIPLVIITHSDVTYISDMRQLAGKKVAVVEGYMAGELIPRDFSDIQLVKVKTVKDGLDRLQKGEVFALVDNMLVISYYLTQLKWGNLKIAGETPYANEPGMAVRKDWAILAGILQKALDSISETERADIYSRWVPIRYEHGFNYKLLWRALALFAVILTGLLVWNQRLSREIRHRKEAVGALRISEQRFRSFVENASDIVYGLTLEGTFTYVSPNWLELTGEPAAQAIGKSFDPYIHPHDARVFREFLKQVLRTGERLASVDYRIRHRDGTIRWLTSKGSPLRDDEGRMTGFVGIGRDVTERKQAEEQIRRLNGELEQRVKDRTAQLEAANEELEAFSYSISHDLRAPLRAITGFANMLAKDYGPGLDAEGRRDLNVVCSESVRMGQLIDDLLRFSRLGRQALRKAPIDMTVLARETYDKLARSVPERVVDFRLEALPATEADPALLQQVWINLLDNALKYTRHRQRAEIAVSGSIEGGEAVYCVKDNGAGFEMKYAGKLFGVFQRLHSPEEFEGTGVGLALVQRVVHRHGGRVWAEAQPERGATFFFTLPITGDISSGANGAAI